MAALVAQYVGVKGSGPVAKPEDTFMITERGCLRRCGRSAVFKRMGPRRLVMTIASGVEVSVWASRFSRRMMPALLMSTFNCGFWRRLFSRRTRLLWDLRRRGCRKLCRDWLG